MTRFAMLAGLVLLAVVGLQPVAHAGPAAPDVTVERVWAVQRGVGLEVAYTISCPDPAGRGLHHALVTNGDYLEFRCGPRPRRVVQLLEGPVAKGERVSLDTQLLTPACMYAPLDPDDLAPGCRIVNSTDTERIKGGRFEPESAAGRGGRVRITQVRAADDGGVSLTARFSCRRPLEGWVPFQVSQMTRDGYTSAGDGGGERYVSCTPGSPQSLSWVARPADGQPPFAFGRRVLVSLDWSFDYEGGQWAYHTGLHRVRPQASPSGSSAQ